MKLGILISRFPYPLEKGDKLRAFHQIKVLSKHHDIYLCAIHTNGLFNKEYLKELEPYCTKIEVIALSKFSIAINLLFSLLFTKLPLQVAYFYNRIAKKRIWSFFENHSIDHLYCQLIRVTEYVRNWEQCPKTIDYMDALSRGMERRIDKSPFYLKPLVKIETTRLKRYEHFIFSDFNYHTIITEQDRDLIIHGENERIKIVRNGVDQKFFKVKTKEKTFDILFTGNMSYPPNVNGVEYLATEIMPEVWKEMPDVTLKIVGATPSPRVQKLANQKIEVTGWVDDIRDYYNEARIFVAPMLIGTGLQNKLLEAMAMDLPCITSPLANNALKAEENISILIGHNKEEFKEHILLLLRNNAKASEVSQNGSIFIKNQYNWETTSIPLLDIIKN